MVKKHDVEMFNEVAWTRRQARGVREFIYLKELGADIHVTCALFDHIQSV